MPESLAFMWDTHRWILQLRRRWFKPCALLVMSLASAVCLFSVVSLVCQI